MDFGDCNVTNTSLCEIEHIYNKTGFVELVLQAKNHTITRRLILVQDAITGFVVNKKVNAISFRDTFLINWKIDTGSMVRFSIDYGDNSTETYSFSSVQKVLQRNNSHIYTGLGVFYVIIMAMNELNSITISEHVIVEIPVNVSCLLIKNLGPFDNIYQNDSIEIKLNVSDGSNPEFLFILGDGINLTQRSTELVYNYPQSGLKNISVIVYNNISAYQLRTVINVRKVFSLGNATLEFSSANVTEPALMILNVSEGFPYLCFWYFGDGSFIQTSSFQNSSFIYHVYKTINVFNVNINCSNNFGFIVQKATVTVQQAIKSLTFTNNCPRQIDEMVVFNISTEERGTNSCFVVNLGDGTFFGFGHEDCSHENVSVRFLGFAGNYFSINYNYSSLGSYDVSVTAWNRVSRSFIQDKALVVKIPCNFPTITVPEFKKDINSRTVFTPLQVVRFRVFITKIDCKATDQKDIIWTVSEVSPLPKDESGTHTVLNPDNKKLEELTIQKKTLAYGVYMIRCNVSMREQYDVYSIEEGFIEIQGNALIAIIEGGSLIQKAFGKPYVMDGSDSRDPDDAEPNLQYYWLCQNASWEIQEDLMSMTSETYLLNVSDYNASTFCHRSRNGTLMKGGSSIEIHTGTLGLHSSYAVALFVSKTVNNHFRISSFTQVVKIVDGDPPVIKIR